MSDYDFKQLNDKEFEILCADLLSEVEKRRFERFKSGRDSGVDGRFFASNGKEVVLQCKHWIGTPTAQLIRKLATSEKNKITRLMPQRYLLAVSNTLSRSEKVEIVNALLPNVVSQNDIYGQEDINDLLKKNPHVEQRHYKLWLHSASALKHIFNNAIIGRSEFSFNEILQNAKRYVVTNNHSAALKLLDETRVVIITGEPGIGKTTLANHLCINYVAKSYEYVKISDNIYEAESVFDAESKQIFYYDDFLGRNYLEALNGNAASHIVQFISRIRNNKNKRFVLTSRSNILSQGKFLSDTFEHANIKRNEYEVNIGTLSNLDKAHILYNHIWHSSLNNDYVEQIYFEQRYRKIIAHKNFNPRLINFITDATRLETLASDKYWDYVEQSLLNPSQVWDNPFMSQLDDFGRAIVMITVLNGRKISEKTLADAYYRYLAFPENQNFNGLHDFNANINFLTGSFLNRTITSQNDATVDLFNPSIGDYVLRRYAKNLVVLRLGLLSLRTANSILTLRNLKFNNYIALDDARAICTVLADSYYQTKFELIDNIYLVQLCSLCRKFFVNAIDIPSSIQACVLLVLDPDLLSVTDDHVEVMQLALEHEWVSEKEILGIIEKGYKNIVSDDELNLTFVLLSSIKSEKTHSAIISKLLKKHVIESIAENFAEYIDVDSVFSQTEYENSSGAKSMLEDLVSEKLDFYGFDWESNDVDDCMDQYEVSYELSRFHQNAHDESMHDSKVHARFEHYAIDAIGDLFDRG